MARDDRKPAKVLVYAIRCEGSSFVKIGRAHDPQLRLRHLQCASPHELTLLAVFTGGSKLERALHRRLQFVHERGEWFWLAEDPVGIVLRAIRETGIEAIQVSPDSTVGSVLPLGEFREKEPEKPRKKTREELEPMCPGSGRRGSIGEISESGRMTTSRCFSCGNTVGAYVRKADGVSTMTKHRTDGTRYAPPTGRRALTANPLTTGRPTPSSRQSPAQDSTE